MSDVIYSLVFAVFVVAIFFGKLFKAVDDDGEIKKTANEGLAAWIERLCKK